MTKKVYRISHATSNTGTIKKSAVSTVMFPASSKAVKPATHSVRNSKQLKLLCNVHGFGRGYVLAFILLAAVLFGVFFLLPQMVTPPDPESLVKPQLEQSNKDAPPDSPWQDAQLAKQRRQAQETLSKILALQQKLEDKKVELWAKSQFQTAMETAAGGDIQYRAREFDKAQQSYRDSLKQFKQIDSQINTVFQQQMNKGLEALELDDPQQALDSFQLALYLKPTSTSAEQGLKRAKVLDQVIELIADGKHLMRIKHYNEAKQQFQQALALDGQSKPAQAQLARAKQAIKDDNFAKAMSDGFNAINQKRYGKAITAFNQALNIRPNAKDALAALDQAKNADIQTRISSHFSQAESFEAQEKWRDALNRYQAIQKLDKSLIKARVGAIRADARAKLDLQLQDALKRPERLTNSKVYRQNTKLLADARKIKQPGPVLTAQVSKLSQLLYDLQKPVTVQLKSNNLTLVTLYKVGELGSFTAKNMDLKPGKYTVVGTREGFRDVRREFTLMPNTQLTTIVVQCEEKITNG